MGEVRSLYLKDGNMIIGDVTNEGDDSITIRYPVTLQPVTNPQTGQQQLTFSPYFPIADYGSELQIPNDMIWMNEKAIEQIAGSHREYCGNQSGLHIATANEMPSEDALVSASEMTKSGLHLTQ